MKLSSLAVFTAILCCFINNLTLWGQNAVADPMKEYAKLVVQTYGQDQELVNGMQYYNRHSLSIGNPYLLEGRVRQGSVTIRGESYQDVWLRYDIHSQQVEVEYQTINGADNQVILVSDRLDKFTIGELFFRKMTIDKGREQIFQVIDAGRLVFYISWEKRLVPVSGNSRFIEEFTSAKRSYQLEMDGAVHFFKNKKRFIKLFPEIIQKDVKKLFRKYNIHFRTASPAQLERFMQAVSGLLNEG
ncbi:MAG: hypothetical protein KAR19_15755 [Bacteroidales bacterium]|nr:hypothetical protein [Bacteroidales bacterium]